MLDTAFVYVRTEAGKPWRMTLVGEEGKLFFRIDEWGDLLRHHDLHYGDIMLFFLKGKSDFELMIYSKTTACPVVARPENEPARNAMNFKNERVIVSDSEVESEYFFTPPCMKRRRREHGDPSNTHRHEFGNCKKSKVPPSGKLSFFENESITFNSPFCFILWVSPDYRN